MISRLFSWQSLKIRITLTTVAIFLAGFWSLSFYASQMLRKDIEQRLGEQQFSTVSMAAVQIDRELEGRLEALRAVAGSSQDSMRKGPSTMQALIEQRPVLHTLFNGGIVAYGVDGVAIADFPSVPALRGVRAMEVDVVAAALKEGRSTIGRPVQDKNKGSPLLRMATPIRNAQGTVIGALQGMINLGIPNFLDGYTENRYGKTGGYLIIAPQYRLVVSATDRSRIMEPLPEPGVNPLLDRFIESDEGSSVMLDPLGVEIMASDKGIPAAGWIMAAVIPTDEAFTPIHDMQRRMLMATIFVSLLAGVMIWWMMRRQLSPALATVELLAGMSDTKQALPVTRQDEIGDLVCGFNRLLETLSRREVQLLASETRFYKLFNDMPAVAIRGYAADGLIRFWNQASEQIYGYTAEEAIGRDVIELIVPPEMRQSVRESLRRTFASGLPMPAGVLSLVRKDGSMVDVLSSHAYIDVPGQAPEIFCIDVDLTERMRMEGALRQREQYLHAVLDNFPFMVWLKDDQSRFLAVNQVFASSFGYSQESLIGKDDLDITAPDLAERYRADDRAVLASGVARQVEELIESGGQRCWFETYKSPITINGDVIGVVGFARDISASKRNEAELVSARVAAENANRAKSRFLAAASHDLRQPLSALSLYVAVLKTRIVDDNGVLVGNIQDCLDSLSGLLSDLLDMSKLDAGVVSTTLSDFSIDELLAGLVSVHSAEAELKGLRLRSRSRGEIVRTDQTLLRRIVGNLLANAIRYTKAGGVLIACRRHRGALWLEVWDTGIGIAESDTGIVFEEFRQLGDSSRNRGSGLGLAIVARAASLLGLRLRLRSRLGCGSMFAIELPQSRGAVPEHARPAGFVGQVLRIGLVDDNVEVLGALVLALENAGHEIVAATSGSALMERLDGRAPDIVISDYRLAALETGFDVIQAVRDVFGSDLPALLITGDTDPLLVRSMADRGIAVQYKPLQFDALAASIDKATERRGP